LDAYPNALFEGNIVDDALKLAMSPVQLAAILSDQPISGGETAANRVWGRLRVVGGSLEMVGAAALLLTPEPMLATKVGGVALGAHGSSQRRAAARRPSVYAAIARGEAQGGERLGPGTIAELGSPARASSARVFIGHASGEVLCRIDDAGPLDRRTDGDGEQNAPPLGAAEMGFWKKGDGPRER
jgi:hypothetical protein